MNLNLDELIKLLDVPKTVEYRVFYDDGKNCTHKEATLKTDVAASNNYVVVDIDTYNNIEFCPNYRIKDGTVVRRPNPTGASIMLEPSKTGPFRTVKNNMMIAVNSDHHNDVDTWDLKNGERNS